MRRLSPVHIGQLYRQHFVDLRREMLFLSGVSFFAAFGVTRVVTRVMFHQGGGGASVKGVHIHHQVVGILMLLGSGYGWLHLAGVGGPDDHRMLRRLNTVAYGVGSALTVDEVALWLNLEDVYWKSPWRELIDGGIVTTSLASIAYWGSPFFRGLGQEAIRGVRGNASARGTPDPVADGAGQRAPLDR